MESTRNDKKINKNNDLENRYLIRFNNGIYDLKYKCFIERVKDEFVQLSVGYDYNEFSSDDPVINEIKSFFNNLEDDEGMRKYLLKVISSWLGGTNKNEEFMFCMENNLTYQLMRLISCTFGEYFDVLPSAILTEEKNQSNPSYIFGNQIKDGKRIVMIKGFQQGDTIYTGLLKELCSGDYIYTCDLGSDPIIFRPQFKLMLVSQGLPYIPLDDTGTWRRLRVLSLQFENVSISSEHYNKIDSWKEGFMWLLINEYYPDYCKSGLKVADKVVKYTNDYRNKILQHKLNLS